MGNWIKSLISVFTETRSGAYIKSSLIAVLSISLALSSSSPALAEASHTLTSEATHSSEAVFSEQRASVPSGRAYIPLTSLTMPVGTAGESAAIPVTNEEELRVAIASAEQDDTIYLSGDITLHSVLDFDTLNPTLTSLALIGTGQDKTEITISESGAFRHIRSDVFALTLTMESLTLTGINNEVSGGGGVECTNPASTLIMNNCTIQNCYNNGNGGGVNATTAIMTGCTVSGNTVGRETTDEWGGGGVYADAAILTSCTAVGNSATFRGGGVCARLATLTNCTIVYNNTLGFGGGIWADGVYLTNCTIALNVGIGVEVVPLYGFYIHGSIIVGNEPFDLTIYGGPMTGEPIPIAPNYNISNTRSYTLADIFGTDTPSLSDNGGPTKTILIHPDGPAYEGIGATEGWTPPSTDQRGVARPQGDFSDVGATELAAYNLTLQVMPAGGGRITLGASGDYLEGRDIPLEAAPSPGYSFVGWSSDYGGIFENASSAATVFTMPRHDVAVIASFEGAPIPDNNDPSNNDGAIPKVGDSLLAFLAGALSFAALIAGTGILIHRRRKMSRDNTPATTL